MAFQQSWVRIVLKICTQVDFDSLSLCKKNFVHVLTFLVIWRFLEDQNDQIWKKNHFLLMFMIHNLWTRRSKSPCPQILCQIWSLDQWTAILAFWVIFVISVRNNQILKIEFVLYDNNHPSKLIFTSGIPCSTFDHFGIVTLTFWRFW